MLRSRGLYLLLLTCVFCFFVPGEARAQAIGCFGNVGAGEISFTLDGKSAQNWPGCGGANLIGPSARLGTTLQGGVGWQGNVCPPGCSANITCYQALDQSNHNGNKAFYSINAVGNGNHPWYWTPPSKATWYVDCDINYYDNPGGSPLGALTQRIVVVVN